MAIDRFSSLENAVFFDLSHVVFVVLNEGRRRGRFFYRVIIGKKTACVDFDYCFLLYIRCCCVSSRTKILTLAFIHKKINEKYLNFY